MAEQMVQTDRGAGPSRRVALTRLILGLVGIVVLVGVGRQFGPELPAFARWINGLGMLGPVVFIAGYVGAAVAFVPGSILTMAAGALFGLLYGTVYVFIASTTASAVAFLIARHLAREAIQRKLQAYPRFTAVDRAIAAHGRKIVLLVRLSPVFPYSLSNYALGLTRVRFRDYMLASVGTIPGTILYVYYGKLAGDIAALAGGVAIERDAGYYAVLGLGLAATLLVTTIVTRIAQRALRLATSGIEG